MVQQVRTPEEWGRGSWNGHSFPSEGYVSRSTSDGERHRKPKRKHARPKRVNMALYTDLLSSYCPPPVERIDGGETLAEME